jgi:hypothetical protein
MDRSRTTVYRARTRLGLAWDRAHTHSAVTAKTRDVAARRTALEDALLAEAETTLAQLHQPLHYFTWGTKGHGINEHTAPEPTPADKLRLMQTVGLAIDRALKIAEHHRTANHDTEVTQVVFTGTGALE